MILEVMQKDQTMSEVRERLVHWRNEYPGLDVFMGVVKGKDVIVGTDEA